MYLDEYKKLNTATREEDRSDVLSWFHLFEDNDQIRDVLDDQGPRLESIYYSWLRRSQSPDGLLLTERGKLVRGTQVLWQVGKWPWEDVVRGSGVVTQVVQRDVVKIACYSDEDGWSSEQVFDVLDLEVKQWAGDKFVSAFLRNVSLKDEEVYKWDGKSRLDGSQETAISVLPGPVERVDVVDIGKWLDSVIGS